MIAEFDLYIRSRSLPNEDGCWVWQRGRFAGGYPQVRYEGKTWRAHRLAHTLTSGPIPAGLVVDHLCSNTLCVNPAHLEAVTQAENVRRGKSATKALCANGHKRSEVNTYTNPTTGHRNCRVCKRIGSRRRTAQGRAA